MDDITLQALLNELARDGGDVPALLQSSDQEVDLPALESEALETFDRIRAGESPSDTDVAALEQLADVVDALRAETTRRDEAAAEQRARVDALASRVARPADTTEAEPEQDGDQGEETAPEDAPAEETPTPPQEDAPAEPVQEPETEAASARRPRVDLGRIARRTQRPQPPTPTGPQLADMLVAAADVPGVPTGKGYESWNEIAQAAIRRFQAMGTPQPGVRQSHDLLVVKKNFPAHLTASGQDDMAILDAAADEHALQGGSLVAAGGWCSPSETLYDLLELESTDGLYSLPEVNASRGGIRFTKGPRFSAIYTANAYWVQTEAQVEAATPKPRFEIPCPDWEEVRMDVEGLQLEAGILTSRTYPEIIARFIRGAVIAHAHRMSKLKIDRVVALADDIGAITYGGPSALSGVLGAIELQAQAYRSRERMQRGTTLELVAPDWILGALRADYANRNGITNPFDVTDAMIRGWFAQRGVNAQFIVDWQPIDGWNPDGTFGAHVTEWPATCQFLMYAAGTFVNLTQDVVNLGVMYDTTNITRNRFNAVFTEDGIGIAMRGFEARLFEVPVVPNGYTGLQVAIPPEAAPAG